MNRAGPKKASLTGAFSPVMKLALITAPVVRSYLPTVPLKLATKRRCSTLSSASPKGTDSPVMKLALITSPVAALYLPTVPPIEFATKSLPKTVRP